MTLPFRFYRGELNGFLISNFLLCHNSAIDDIQAELVYQALVTWALGDNVEDGQLPITSDDLYGLALFAGVESVIQYQENSLGCLAFTGKNIVGGAEYSERGLFNMATGLFVFFRSNGSSYSTDIDTLASSAMRMSFVPHGATPVGYVPYGVDLYDQEGNVIEGNLLSDAPTDGSPYTTYYGEKYLVMQESFLNSVPMPDQMFMDYFSCIMRMKQDGASIFELCFLTSLLCEDYVTDLSLTANSYFYTLHYSLNEASTLPNQQGALGAWLWTIAKRFPNILPVQNS